MDNLHFNMLPEKANFIHISQKYDPERCLITSPGNQEVVTVLKISFSPKDSVP